jgi:F-type H+-transporting ATPase subunit delta
VAVPLDEQQKAALTAALEAATGKQLDLKVFVDPDVVGGVLARVGDVVIDGTLSKRLADVKSRVGR